jgi:8-oxo-dGTP diphosphatase
LDKNKSINIIAILHNEKNQILTIKKKVGHFKNYLSLPGGFVNFKERIEDTIKREVNEKLSLIIEPLDILGVYSDFKGNNNGIIISIVFICLIIDQLTEEKKEKKNLEKRENEEESLWIDLKNISQYEFASNHKVIIEDYLKWRNHSSTYWSSKLR